MPAPSPALPAPTAAARPATRSRTLANGLAVIVEPMPRVRSAALALLVPAGSACDPPGKNASAAVLCDLLTRGAAGRDSRAFTQALDDLGVNRGESVGAAHLSVTAATVAENLPAALRLYRDLFREPHLPESEFAPAADGLRQSLRAIEDEPGHRVMLELRRRTYPAPWGLPTDGTLAGLDALTYEDVKRHYRSGPSARTGRSSPSPATSTRPKSSTSPPNVLRTGTRSPTRRWNPAPAARPGTTSRTRGRKRTSPWPARPRRTARTIITRPGRPRRSWAAA